MPKYIVEARRLILLATRSVSPAAILRAVLIPVSMTAVMSCTILEQGTETDQSWPTQTTELLTDVAQCRVALQGTATTAAQGLDLSRMRLLNWNTQKNTNAAMQADMRRLAGDADLILLQEALHRSKEAFASLDDTLHWSFSPGYQTAKFSTGVMTASRVKPLAQCSLTNVEPWLRTPKATNITKFALLGTDETLLVLNLHLINFTFGIAEMHEQLAQALSFVDQHDGPVIVSGDFNTWRKGRVDMVTNELRDHGLEPVGYAQDYRKRVFGYALDHTFVRDIRIAESTSHPVKSSDHNPMSVTLEF